MRMNRRNVLLGLGTMVVGGGGALATGAFSTVSAERSVTIDVAEDDSGSAMIGLEPGDSDYVTTTDGVFEIDFSDLGDVNVDATLTVEDAFNLTNNADEELSIRFEDDATDISVTLVDSDGSDLTSTTLGAGSSEDDIDVVVETPTGVSENPETFDVTLTITAEPTTS